MSFADAKTRWLRSKNLLCALSFSLALGLFALPALADNSATLSKLEKWLFFATFAGESDESRIKRIETKTFGEPAEGSLDERLKKLDELLTERQKEKEDLDPALKSTPPPAQPSPPVQSTGGTTPAATPQAEVPSGGGQTETESMPGPSTTAPGNPAQTSLPPMPSAKSSPAAGRQVTPAQKGSPVRVVIPHAGPSSRKAPATAAQPGAQGASGAAGSGPNAFSAQGYPGQAGVPGQIGSRGQGPFPGQRAQTGFQPGMQQGAQPGQGWAPGPGGGAAGGGRPDAEQLKERQRIAVQAAREQEMQDLLQEGARLWRSRHGQEAVEHFEQVLRLDPQNPDAHFSIGVIQEALGKLKEAKEHYEEAAKASPDNKDYNDAVAAVNRRILAGPADPNKALLEKANAAFKRGEYVSALNLYKELEEKAPKQASVKFSLGTTYLMMKDHFKALENYKLAHQLEPNNAKYTSAFNELSAEMAKHQEAQKNIEAQYHGGNQQPGMPPPQMPGQGSLPMAQGTSQMQQPYPGYSGQPASFQPQQMQQSMPQQMQQSMPQQMQQSMPQQMQQPMMQRPMGQMPMQQYPYAGMQQNPYGGQMSFLNSQGGTYIPPDPQQYSSSSSRQPISQQMQQQMPQQMPQQMQQQMPQQMQQQMPQQMQQQMPQQMQQQVPQQMSQQQQQYGGSQYGGAMGNQGQDYTPAPQAAPQGAYDPALAQQLNSGGGAKAEPMSKYGISGKSCNEGIMVTAIRGGSRAARAGLRQGDVIRTVDGNEVMQPSQLNQVLSQYDSSQTLPILIFRQGTLTPVQF